MQLNSIVISYFLKIAMPEVFALEKAQPLKGLFHFWWQHDKFKQRKDLGLLPSSTSSTIQNMDFNLDHYHWTILKNSLTV